MKNQSWVASFLSFLTFIMLVSSGILLWTDTYSVANPYSHNFIDEPNRNFLKVEHILANPSKYDGFIFGSSRVGAILPSHVRGAKFYNMTYSEGIPREHLLNLQLFLKKGVKVKKILLGLDEFSYQVSFEKHQYQWITKAHPLATEETWFSFYRFYFFRLLTQHDKRQFLKKISYPDKTITMDIADQEPFYKSFLSPKSNVNPNHPIYLQPTLYNGNTLENTLQDIQEIVQLCDTNKIELTIFLNPVHHTTYKYTDKMLLSQFKDKLAKITAYYDFSGPNALTTDNRNFVDSSHYTIDVGDSLLRYMTQANITPESNISSVNLSYFKPFKSK